MNFRRLSTHVALIIIGLTAPLPAGEPDRATPVVTVPVELSTEALPVEATGVITRKAEVELSFLVAGLVREVAVRAGDAVTNGQLLAALRLDEVEAQLAGAKAVAAQARRERERQERLYASGATGLEEFQRAQTVFAQAAAALKQAEFAREHAVIRAPGPGRILRRSAEPDQLLDAGQPVLAFAGDAEGWLLRVSLAARDTMRIQVGDVATWSLAGAPGQLHAARVSHMAEGSAVSTRTTEVELVPEGVPADVRSGFIIHARIQPGPVPARPKIPASAIVEGQGDQAGLFLLEPSGDHVRRVAVTVAEVHGASVFLNSVLSADDRVVLRGAEFLHDGAAVAVAEPGAAPVP